MIKKFGIYDIQNNVWVLDCFEYVQAFFDKKTAEKYRTDCKDYNSDRYEVRIKNRS